jgi:hypothetical protein
LVAPEPPAQDSERVFKNFFSIFLDLLQNLHAASRYKRSGSRPNDRKLCEKTHSIDVGFLDKDPLDRYSAMEVENESEHHSFGTIRCFARRAHSRGVRLCCAVSPNGCDAAGRLELMAPTDRDARTLESGAARRSRSQQAVLENVIGLCRVGSTFEVTQMMCTLQQHG